MENGNFLKFLLQILNAFKNLTRERRKTFISIFWKIKSLYLKKPKS